MCTALVDELPANNQGDVTILGIGPKLNVGGTVIAFSDVADCHVHRNTHVLLAMQHITEVLIKGLHPMPSEAPNAIQGWQPHF